MKRKIHITFLVSLLSFIGYTQGSLSVHFHIAPPSSVFGGGIASSFYGDVDFADPFGFAGVGLGLGLEYHHPIKEKKLSILVSTDIIRNPIKRILRQQYKLSLDESETIKFSSYYNVPITLGLHYDIDIKGFPFFIQGGPVLDILKISDSKETYMYSSGNSSSYVEKYGLSFSFGFGVRAGVILKDKYIFGFGYKALGNHNIRNTSFYTFSDGDVDTYTEITTKKIGMLTISAGLKI